LKDREENLSPNVVEVGVIDILP